MASTEDSSLPRSWGIGKLPDYVKTWAMKNAEFHINQSSKPLKDFKQHDCFCRCFKVYFSCGLSCLSSLRKRNALSLLTEAVNCLMGNQIWSTDIYLFLNAWPSFKCLFVTNFWISRISRMTFQELCERISANAGWRFP